MENKELDFEKAKQEALINHKLGYEKAKIDFNKELKIWKDKYYTAQKAFAQAIDLMKAEYELKFKENLLETFNEGFKEGKAEYENVVKILNDKLDTLKKEVLKNELDWLKGYFENQIVYLPDLKVYATDIIKDRINLIEKELK